MQRLPVHEKLMWYSVSAFMLITAAGCVSLADTDGKSLMSIAVENSITIRNSPVISISDDGRYIVYAADTGNETTDGRQLRLRDLYSINMLPPFWQKVTLLNPVVYLISGFRWSFYGIADVNVATSLSMIFVFLLILLVIIWRIFSTGYRLKN